MLCRLVPQHAVRCWRTLVHSREITPRHLRRASLREAALRLSFPNRSWLRATCHKRISPCIRRVRRREKHDSFRASCRRTNRSNIGTPADFSFFATLDGTWRKSASCGVLEPEKGCGLTSGHYKVRKCKPIASGHSTDKWKKSPS